MEEETTEKLMWWGYLHTSGTIQIKRYFDKRDIEEAQESEFCKQVIAPFPAENRMEAEKIIYGILEYDMKPSDAEAELFYCMRGTGGGFITKLFHTIMAADIHNQAKLALGFPHEVRAAQRYMSENGYWERLEKRMVKNATKD